MVRSGFNAERTAKLPPKFSVSGDYAAISITERGYRPSDDVVFGADRAWVNGFGECVAVDLGSGRADAFCAEAREIAATVTERAESTWSWARCRELAGNTNGALALYAGLIGTDPL